MAVIFSLVLIASHPDLYKRNNRIVRDVLRTLLGASIGWPITMLFSQYWHISVVMIAVCWLLKSRYSAIRRKNKLQQCQGCVELNNDDYCSGFKFQVENVRRYEIEATEAKYKAMKITTYKK